MTTLYLQMTEKLSEHWRANNNAYPQKFVLSPALRAEYVHCLELMTIPGERDMSATNTWACASRSTKLRPASWWPPMEPRSHCGSGRLQTSASTSAFGARC